MALPVALHETATPARDIAIYGLYLLVGIVIPGTLVHRALRGSRGNLPEDLGLGAATGLLLQLLGWLLGAVTSGQAYLRYWPLLIIAVFVAVPKLWKNWRIAEPRPLPLRWSWLMAGTMLVIILWGLSAWWTTPLPPVTVDYYQDMMYHLALVHEMTRSVPFQVPQLAGDSLRYHYLSDADMAAASMITGIEPSTVLLRLWPVPIGMIAALVVAVLGRDLTGRWWAGPLAAAGAFASLPLILGTPAPVYVGSALSYASPSQTYAMPLLSLLVVLAADVLRERPLRWAWILVLPLAVACAGAKSSALPPFLAGLLLAGLVLAIRRRRIPWTVAGMVGCTLVAMAIGLRLFAGGGAGVLGLQPLSVLRWMMPYSETIGAHDGIARGGLLPGGVAHATVAGMWFIAGVIAWWLLMQTSRLAGLAALITRPCRTDPVAWLLGGMILAGTGAAWLLWHPSASETYFMLCALPFGILLTVRLLADQVRRWEIPVVGLLAGALWVLVAPHLAPPAKTMSAWSKALWQPVGLTALVMLAAVAVGVIALVLIRRPGPASAWARRISVAVIAATLGGSVASAALTWGSYNPVKLNPARAVTAAEQSSALWLLRNSDKNDIVATNVHCVPISRVKRCDARAFWVAGLGGRRTLVESWGYSDATVAANGVNDLKYPLQPAPNQELFAFNQRAFTDPTPALLAQLRGEYQVKWLFADTRAGAVSPALRTLATPVLTSGPVTIYRL